MNPEMHILNNQGCLIPVWNEINDILSSNIGTKFSSYELFAKFSDVLKNQLETIAATYEKGPCSSPPAYVGSVASSMSNTEANIVHDYNYFCPILNRIEDGFVKTK
ncbi:MAG: hypothetical protein BI182_02490 [Acetobacterium sp. MES1]|uniref:Uncharacterized protein n=1 Tax=Acetobacterium wieringae TaxID=52694 RepID=A0A5D0WQF0_9FIRM|nr:MULTISPECIES: hypothetical protein [Acetobacterium]OXS26595.1 MAG: hypothetical protein BI182_02490 [Acetobacterium sp. MES1]TYC86505.1 hypothetical protein FXB42_06515 [Acetobacterium wieringae]